MDALPQKAPRTRLLVVTGIGGGGKSTTLHALEDAGLRCIDNLPPSLLEPLLARSDRVAAMTAADGPRPTVAVSMDVRGVAWGAEVDDAVSAIEAQAARGRHVDVLFLDCDDHRLVNRYKETRRRHPLMTTGDAEAIGDALAQERRWLTPLRGLATTVIDTTRTTVHDLKRRAQVLYGDPTRQGLQVHLMSFGFRSGLPAEADYAFDVRFIPNPYFDLALRPLTGQDPRVSEFVLSQPTAASLMERLEGLFVELLPLAAEEGKATVTIAIGCTGGQHRSVALVEALSQRLATHGWAAYVSHRDMPRIKPEA